MGEDFLAQIDRVNMMVRDQDGDWDLSPNDRAALKALLDFVGKSALTPPAAEEHALAELPEGWYFVETGTHLGTYAQNGHVRVWSIMGMMSIDTDDISVVTPVPIAVVLAVISRNAEGTT